MAVISPFDAVIVPFLGSSLFPMGWTSGAGPSPVRGDLFIVLPHRCRIKLRQERHEKDDPTHMPPLTGLGRILLDRVLQTGRSYGASVATRSEERRVGEECRS